MLICLHMHLDHLQMECKPEKDPFGPDAYSGLSRTSNWEPWGHGTQGGHPAGCHGPNCCWTNSVKQRCLMNSYRGHMGAENYASRISFPEDSSKCLHVWGLHNLYSPFNQLVTCWHTSPDPLEANVAAWKFLSFPNLYCLSYTLLSRSL